MKRKTQYSMIDVLIFLGLKGVEMFDNDDSFECCCRCRIDFRLGFIMNGSENVGFSEAE